MTFFHSENIVQGEPCIFAKDKYKPFFLRHGKTPYIYIFLHNKLSCRTSFFYTVNQMNYALIEIILYIVIVHSYFMPTLFCKFCLLFDLQYFAKYISNTCSDFFIFLSGKTRPLEIV